MIKKQGNTWRIGNDVGASPPPVALPRKERSKSRDLQKKMGGGKKGMWGKPEDLITAPVVDPGDPNFDSEGEVCVVLFHRIQ